MVENGISQEGAGGGDLFFASPNIELARDFAELNTTPANGPPTVVEISIADDVAQALQESGQMIRQEDMIMFQHAWDQLGDAVVRIVEP